MKRNLVQKIASVVAAGTLMMGALSGCGASNASVDSNESSATVESSDSSVTAESAGYRTLDEIKESGTINIGVFSDKSPFGYVDENGEYQAIRQRKLMTFCHIPKNLFSIWLTVTSRRKPNQCQMF